MKKRLQKSQINSNSQNQKTPQRILILGAGHFGTCLAQHLAEVGHAVTIYARSNAIVQSINTQHQNPKYLSHIRLHPTLIAINTIKAENFANVDAVVFVSSTQAMRDVLLPLKKFLLPRHLFVCAAKGIEVRTLKLPEQIIKEICGAKISRRAVYLSGPSFATEIAQKLPTAVTMAGRVKKCVVAAQDIFHTSYFRVYSASDTIGLEVAGALKNVIAIASGAAMGLGFQMNTRAALITRGLNEMIRVGIKLGAKPVIFTGLSGVGDLFLTCSSEKSRNFTLGLRLGRGESVDHILATMDSVAEGYTTAKAAFQLAKKLKISTPIIDEVYHVLYEEKPVKEALTDLITREAKPEFSQR